MFNVAFINALREREMERLADYLPKNARILEFGAGTGQQARYLADRGFDVVAIDLEQSEYADHRLFPVQDYNGRDIPLPDASVDVIFSSNVMEHVEDIPAVLKEFKRILTPKGFAVHAMPTPTWRFWTFASGLPTAIQSALLAVPHAVRPPAGQSRGKAVARDLRRAVGAILPRGHGTSPEGISELWTFSAPAWRRLFRRHGFRVVEERAIGLFYTGHMLFGARLSFRARERLSRLFGSSTRIYVVR